MPSTGFSSSMSASDSVMWTIERDPELRSTVVAISMLDKAPDQRRLRARVEQAIRDIPRLRQVVRAGGPGDLTPVWADVDDVNIDYHFRRVASPDPEDHRWLLEYATTMAESGFDKSRPLWEMVIVERLSGGTAAIVLKVHHSMTDGVGGVQLLMTLLEPSRDSSMPLSELAPADGEPPPRSLAHGITETTDRLIDYGTHLPQNVLNAMRTALSLGRLLAPAGGRRSPVLVGHSTDWYFDICERPLDDLRRAGKAAGASVNDVFLAALAAGLHRYHLAHGRDVDELRLTLPVSLRQPGDPPGGNRFVPVRFGLPVSELDPVTRIQQVRSVSRRWRNEPALPLSNAIAGVLNLLPAPVTTAVMGSLLKGVDLVATNVPGVPSECYIAGAEVTRQFAFAPLSGAAVNAALVSHVDTACIGVNIDRLAVPDPEVLMACISDGLDETIGSTDERRP